MICFVFLFYSFEKLQKTQEKGKITSEILQFSIYNVEATLDKNDCGSCTEILIGGTVPCRFDSA